ncbi:phospholipase C [Arthrobacter sp. Hiyo8]|nr:phospholipase C [Arthrobacter sp. Hiyo8]
MISPFAKKNFVDHTQTDQSSILRFIEDNWHTGQIGDSSADAKAGSINAMFNFDNARDVKLILNESNGTVVSRTKESDDQNENKQ